MHTPEYDFFHHLAWTIRAGQMFHDSSISAQTLHRMSPEDRAKAADLVQRYAALCDESRALSDHHKALSKELN